VDDAGAVYPVTIDPVIVPAALTTAKFTGVAANDRFGVSVALNQTGDTALVGAVENNAGAGAAYIFEKGTGWTNKSAAEATAKFTGEAAKDSFGWSVALDQAGSTALIGAHGNNSNSGSAYIFEKGTIWTNKSAASATAKLTGEADQDFLGLSVALSGDGQTAFIGAYGNNSRAGAAYIFNKGTGWTNKSAASATAKFTGVVAEDRFGWSVALNQTGDTALVGATGNNAGAGAAYIFEKGTGWTNKSAADATAKFTGETVNNWFGWSVALGQTGSTALVGEYGYKVATGAAYIFEKGTGWTNKSAADATAKFTGETVNNWFGWSVALNQTGDTALVGAYWNNAGIGAAYIFEKGGGWTNKSATNATAKFIAESAGHFFGISVALDQTGSTAFVGADGGYNIGNAGTAYLFTRPHVTLTAGGTTTGKSGEVVNGLTLNPTLTLTYVDIYLSTYPGTVSGTPVKRVISELTAFTDNPVGGVDLIGTTVGTYYLIVTESGTTTVLGATSFAVYTVTGAAPTFGSITPPSGPIAGGTVVTITGTNLFGANAGGANNVTFGGVNATSFTVGISGTSITATTPNHIAGTFDVVITTPNGTTTGGTGAFTYIDPGSGGGGGDGPGPGDSGISGISPGSGTSGTTVQTTITGSNFPTTTKKSTMNRGFIEGYETRSVSYQDGAGTTTIKVWLSHLGESSIT
jgi:hypothetical protein